MSELDDDLELQALQRELDDAFATTRPRRGFEDELWLRMQQRRPLWTRLGDAVAGFGRSLREAPGIPATVVAVLVVVALGAGVVQLGGLGNRGGAGSAANQAAAPVKQDVNTGGFGALPVPGTSSVPRTSQEPAMGIQAGPDEYQGPVQLSWKGTTLDLSLATAPVYRYQEPTTSAADAFASRLGAALNGRPAGLLGTYTAASYTLSIQGTTTSPAVSPAYFILSSPAMPDVVAAGATPRDIASLFLAEHGLTPQWPYSVDVAQKTGADKTADLTIVRFIRQFTVTGYTANLVDAAGNGYGIEVDLRGNHTVRVAGILPVDLVGQTYPIVSSDAAVQRALATSTPGAPAVELTQAALVYVLVPAGDHSFYEPAYLFSGSFKLNGSTYVKHVLVPAIGQ